MTVMAHVFEVNLLLTVLKLVSSVALPNGAAIHFGEQIAPGIEVINFQNSRNKNLQSSTPPSFLLLGNTNKPVNPPAIHNEGSLKVVRPNEIGSGQDGLTFPDSDLLIESPEGSGNTSEEGSGYTFGIVHFPENALPINKTSSVFHQLPATNPNVDLSKCKSEGGYIYFEGQCHYLLSSVSCSEGQWLIINQYGEPDCVTKPCPEGQLLYKDVCVNIDDNSVCGPNEILYVDFTGNVHCDCEKDYVYDRGNNRCYLEHQRGSCDFGFYLEINAENRLECTPNPCRVDDLVLNQKTNDCYRKLFKGACRKENGWSLVFNDNFTALCVTVHNRNIFEVPALTSCPAGSKRDYLGNCQAVLRLGPSSPFSYRVPSRYTTRYSACPPDYTKYPDGSCKKNNALFG